MPRLTEEEKETVRRLAFFASAPHIGVLVLKLLDDLEAAEKVIEAAREISEGVFPNGAGTYTCGDCAVVAATPEAIAHVQPCLGQRLADYDKEKGE